MYRTQKGDGGSFTILAGTWGKEASQRKRERSVSASRQKVENPRGKAVKRKKITFSPEKKEKRGGEGLHPRRKQS